MSHVRPGAVVTTRELTAVSGEPVAVPDDGRLVHLQFRRFAGCPVCNLHLRSVVRRHAEIEAAGIREVVVFHSPAEELAGHVAGLPFAVIADPGKRLYAEFGVESARRALLSPRAWPPIVRAVTRSLWEIVRGRERAPAVTPHGGRLGLPADLLIAQDGRVVAVKYGEHAYDQWSVEELLRHASDVPAGASR
jgi:peroxiredoxin